MARKQDNYQNDFLGHLRWNNEWFLFHYCSFCSGGMGTLALARTSLITSQEERGHPHDSCIDEDHQSGASRWGF